MNTAHQIPVISGDAGNPQALSNPNSPASIMKRAKETHAQTAADTKYDAAPPPRNSVGKKKEGFAGLQGRRPGNAQKTEESVLGFLVASSFLLFLYSIAPEA